ncbi:MAG TPA: hypothetical protein VF553_14950 [Pyrinomonadaceae bacterium]|jgi:hypothetical protein
MMRHIGSRLISATLTFIIGLSISSFRHDSHYIQRQGLCDATLNLRDSARQPVTIRGMLYGSPDGKLTLNELECGGAWVEVEIDRDFQATDENQHFVESLTRLSQGDRMARAEVIIGGQLTDRKLSSSEQRFVIRATGLEQVGAISLISLVSN